MSSSAVVGAAMRGATVLRRAHRATSASVLAPVTSTVPSLDRLDADPLVCFEHTVASLTDSALADALPAMDTSPDSASIGSATERSSTARTVSPARPAGARRLPVVADLATRPDPRAGFGRVPARTDDIRPAPRRQDERPLPSSGRPDALVGGADASTGDRHRAGSRAGNRSIRTPTWASRAIAEAASTPIRAAGRHVPAQGALLAARRGATGDAVSQSVAVPRVDSASRDPRGAASDPNGAASPRVVAPDTHPATRSTMGPQGLTTSAPTQLAGLARWWDDTHGPAEPSRVGDAASVTSAEMSGSSSAPTASSATSSGLPSSGGDSHSVSFENTIDHLDEFRAAFGGLLEDLLVSEARAEGIEVRP